MGFRDRRVPAELLTNIILLKYYFFNMATQIEFVSDRARATHLIDPLRAEILRRARYPISASELAPLLGLSRQRINYHVRRLAADGLLRRAGRRRRRNLFEQRYTASSSAYLLSPALLGPLGADWRRIGDASSPDHLLALTAQVQADASRASAEAARAEKSFPAIALKFQFRFEKPEQREAFSRALRAAVVEVIARHTSPYLRGDGGEAAGEPYRLVLGSYPYLPEEPV
jgi:DNA-binding transcriptional ArsR family regulator